MFSTLGSDTDHTRALLPIGKAAFSPTDRTCRAHSNTVWS